MKKAFTIVEMLVTLVLVSLLIGVAVFAFRLQLITIHKTKTEGLNNAIKYTQIRSLFESMKYYVVDDYDMLNEPMKNLHYFFKGNEKSVEFITTNPLFSDEDALVKLTCTDDKLLYKEEALFKKIDFLKPSFLKDSKTKEIYTNLKKCGFSYRNLKDKKTNILENSIPKTVSLFFETNIYEELIYVKIRSDNNTTVGKVYDAMYSSQ